MMTELHDVELRGCFPEPLMSYLKALGIFRLVSEQADSAARGWWKNDTFYIRSTLDRDALKTFFLNGYRPTPIVSPWNGSSSITSKAESKNLDEKLLAREEPRFQLWNEVVSTSRRIFNDSERIASKDRKEWVLAQCRSHFPDDALDWLDATYVLTSGGRADYPPLLGTGGNDGRLEFSRNYFQNVVLALNLDEKRNGETVIQDQVAAALFNEGSPRLARRTNGFFNPGSVGGANSSVGFDGRSLTNPWDYVLMFEGALMFAGAAARRLSPQARTKAVFPFTADNSASGYGTSSDTEYSDSARAEFWAPLWDSPATLNEITYLMAEGRAQVGSRQATTGADFSRAVAGLGADRGVRQFQRYGFFVRNGLAYLAAPLGRFHTPTEDNGIAERANVLFDLDGWLNSLRRNASGSSAPAGLRTSLSRIERAIIEFCQLGRAEDIQNVLIAVGHAERWLSRSRLRESVGPINELSGDWLTYADDNFPEFRLARSLASILQGRVGAIRENLEPVKVRGRGRVDWDDSSKSFVWNAGDPLANMLAVLARRCLDGRAEGEDYPPLTSQYSARLSDIVAFLNGEVDVQRVVDLVLPLSFVHYRASQDNGKQYNAPFQLPAAYAALKLTFLPRKFVCGEFRVEVDIRYEPSILAMLRAGRVGNAYEVARRRLVSSGLRPLADAPGIADRSELGRRLGASLLFPLDETTHTALAQRALLPPREESR